MASKKDEIHVTEEPVHQASLGSSNQQDETNQEKGLVERITSVLDSWYYLWEVFGILISALAIVALCMVVYTFDGNPAPNWTATVPGRQPFQLTINSLLSILAVLGSTCAMIPVTKSLGQLKYLWFMEQDRKLADLEIFDSASRGKFGSAQLIWKLRFKHLAVLGGLASLLALAYGPFVQNLVVIEIQYRDGDQNALLSYSSVYGYEPQEGTGIDSLVQFSLDKAIKDNSAEWVIPDYKCRTGACIWDTYNTLAACSRCTDISHLLKRTCTPMATDEDGYTRGGCNVSLPNGFSLSNLFSNDSSTVLSDFNPFRTVLAMNSSVSPLVYNYTRPLALVQTIFGLPQDVSFSNTSNTYVITEDSRLSAQECAIIPCIQKQRLSLSRPSDKINKLKKIHIDEEISATIDIIEQWDNYTAQPDSDIYIYANDPTSTASKQQTADIAVITDKAYTGLRNHLSRVLTGHVFSYTSRQSESDFRGPGFKGDGSSAALDIFGHAINQTWGQYYCSVNQTKTTEGGISCGMDKIAAGLTSAFRRWTWLQVGTNENYLPFNGTTQNPQQICLAQWQYISAPVAVWLLGLVLFIGVVIKTRRANIKTWRTSPLATLLLGLDPETREHMKDWKNMGDAELRNVAEEVRLQLRVDEHGPRLVKNGGESAS